MLTKLHPSNNKNAKGDTLIEVLLAVTVLSLVIVAAMSLMNQGTTASIRSLQITVVRQEIDNQAETLRYLNSAFVSSYEPGKSLVAGSAAKEYEMILDNIKSNTSASQFNSGQPTCVEPPTTSFFVNVRSAKLVDSRPVAPETYSQLVYNDTATEDSINEVTSHGLWIEGVRSARGSAGSSSSYTDFHIRACWQAPGASMPMNLGTIVRLYDPAG